MTTKKRPLEHEPLDFNSLPPEPTRLVVINPLSKGRVGKTTFYEYLATTLERSGIDWQGANLDDRHEAFQQRHPLQVQNFYAEASTAVDEYLPVFTAARRSTAPVYLIDQRAQADRNFLAAAERTDFLRQAALEGVGIVAVCIALDDLDYLINLSGAIDQLSAQGVTRWVLVNHPLIAANGSFPRTPVMRQLDRLGAVTINVPAVSKPTFNRLAHLAATQGSAVGFRDAVLYEDWQTGDGVLCRCELEDAMGRMELQFRQHADVFLPRGLKFKDETATRLPSVLIPAKKTATHAEFASGFLQ